MAHHRKYLQYRRGGVFLRFIAGCLLALAACSVTDTAPSLPGGKGSGISVDHGRHADAVLSGTVTYHTRLALPRNAIVEVSLLTVSEDPSPVVIAAHRFQVAGQPPIRFDLPYEPSRLINGHKYGVRAQILVDGALWFINEQPVPVVPGSHPGGVQIVVRPAAEG